MSKGMNKRNDRLLKEKRHDAYQEVHKLPEPTVCSECGALFTNGRWSWNKKPAQPINETLCPACRRIAEKYPAGYVEMKGQFFVDHQDEILNLARNVGEQEKNERPLERIMHIQEKKDHTIVTTTGIHLARRIGEALSRSYKGDLNVQYTKDDTDVRVYWERSE